MVNAHNANDLALLKNTPVSVEFLLYSVEQTLTVIRLYVNVNKTGFRRFLNESWK